MAHQYIHFVYFSILLSSAMTYGYVPYKQTDATFDTKVRKYLSTIKDKLIEVPDGLHILESIVASKNAIDTNKLVILMSAVQEINLSGSAISADQIRAALLIQFTVSIIEKFRQELLTIITELEAAKQYWEFYRDHPSYYESFAIVERFSRHKTTELNTKINALDAYLDKQYANLGSLTIHLDSFDELQSPDDQFAWVHQLSSIIISAYPGAHLEPNVITSDIVLKLVAKMNKCVMHYALTTHAEIQSYLLPSFFKRNWFKLMGTAVAFSYGSYYTYAKKDVIADRIKQSGKSLSNYGITQYQLAKEALFEGEITGEKLQQEEKILKQDYQHVLLELHKSLTYIKPNNSKLEKSNDELAPVYVEHSAINSLDPHKRKDFNPTTITEKSSVLDMLDFLDNNTLPVLAHISGVEGREFAASLKEVAQKLANVDTSISKNVFGVGKTANSIVVEDVLRQVGKGPIDKIASLTDTLTKYSDVVVLYGRLQKFQGKQLLWELKKHNLINLAIVSAIPACIVLWFGGKALYTLYKKMRGIKVYDSVRNALVDIAMILNTGANPLEMLPQDYGRLLYLIYRLADEQRNIPQKFRTAFLHDVKLLQSSALSTEQKLQVIDLIYKRYPFLSNDERSLRSVPIYT